MFTPLEPLLTNNKHRQVNTSGLQIKLQAGAIQKSSQMLCEFNVWIGLKWNYCNGEFKFELIQMEMHNYVTHFVNAVRDYILRV